MRAFKCQSCGNAVYFDNVRCLTCGHALGFDADSLQMVTMVPAPNGGFRVLSDNQHGTRNYCENSQHGVCNWLTHPRDANGLCRACDLNRLIPNLANPEAREAWAEIERAKKRLAYSLLRFGLPLDGRRQGKPPMTFDFVADTTTGHLGGVITIDIDEVDDVERTRQQQQLEEPYRTVLGHLRHESGHYYWMLLVEHTRHIDGFRAIFGDERADYQEAISRHYGQGPISNWQTEYVSAYASSHPWEDWAETWAHYLHMVDVIETTQALGVDPNAVWSWLSALWPFGHADVYRDMDFDAMNNKWIPLAVTMNELNRSMGHDDFYPFVTPDAARRKLEFIHRVIREAAAT